MAEPATLPPPPEPLAYRPLSGYAVAGCIVSVLFTVLVLGSTLVAMVQGTPFFFPAWFVLPAAVSGLVLSLLGLQQIKNSEGTRAGLALARTGVWLSIFSGLGYFSYSAVTELALTSQADAFLRVADSPSTGFFLRLENAAKANDPVELRTAFLLTLPATARGGVKPEDAAGMAQVHDQPTRDGGPGKLTLFKHTFLVRAYGKGAQALGPITVEPLGVQGWDYKQGSYEVRRNYRLRSGEVELEFMLPVGSTEGESAGQMRQWFVNLNATQHDTRKQRKFTPIGQALLDLRQQAVLSTVARWVNSIQQGDKSDAFKPEQTDWDRLISNPEKRAAVRRYLTAVLTGEQPGLNALAPMPFDGIGDWEFTSRKHLLLLHRMPMRLSPRPDFPGGNFDVVVETTSRRPVDPAELATTPTLEWDISAVRIDRAAIGDPNEKGPAMGPRLGKGR